MKIAQWISNSGTEPVLPEGAAAALISNGALVGKAIFDPQRLLPGERLDFPLVSGRIISGKLPRALFIPV